MTNFQYYCPTRIVMGTGKSTQLPELLQSLDVGKSILLVSDPGIVQAGLVEPIQMKLQSAGYRVILFTDVSQNPRDTECILGSRCFYEEKADAVVAVGGGSAMDTAKAIALIGRNGGTPVDYAEGRRPYQNVAPIICIPTTAGTGSEVTRSSVITEASTHRKRTLKDAALRPTLAILDPELTYTLPKEITAATGVDALVHAIEGYTCKVTNPISQALGAKAMELIISALPAAYHDGRNEQARANMLLGSLLAGLCFGSADVAAVHCLAEAIGGLYDTPHGIANAVFLPYVLKFNAEENKKLHAEIARHMKLATSTDSDEKAVEQLIDGIGSFTRSLNIPRLKDLPLVRKEDFEKIVELAIQNGATRSNVREMTANDYRVILEEAYKD